MEDKNKKSEESSQSSELQLVIFKIGSEEFGVDISQVREIVRMVPITPVPRAAFFIEGVVNLRGQVVAVVDLAKRLSLDSQPRTDKTRIVVVELRNQVVGAIVDEVTEVIRLPSSNIEEAPEFVSRQIQQQYLRGVGKIDERLIILIDLAEVFSKEEIEQIKETKKNSKEADKHGGEKKV